VGQPRLVARQILAPGALGDVGDGREDRRLATPRDAGGRDLDPEAGGVLAIGLATVARRYRLALQTAGAVSLDPRPI